MQASSSSSNTGLIAGAVALVVLLGLGIFAAINLFGGDDEVVVADEREVEIDDDGPPSDEDFFDVEDEDLVVDDLRDGEPEDAQPEVISADSLRAAEGEVVEVTGTLAEGEVQSYELDLDEGAVVGVTVQGEAGGLDPIVTVVGPDGFEVARNDDAPSSVGLSRGLDSHVTFEAESSGVHIIEVEGFLSTVGDFVVTVNRSGERLFFDGVSIEDERDISVGVGDIQQFDGEISETQGLDRYVIELEAGAELEITVEAQGALNSLDTVVEVLTADGVLIDRNDDAFDDTAVSGSLDSQLLFIAPDSGTFFIEVTDFSSDTGAYLLTISRTG